MRKLICCVALSSMFLMGCSLELVDKVEVPPLESRLITVSNISTAQEIASAVEPAIVGISGISRVGESVGSGVCVADGGYVLTNSHVVHDCDTILLHMSNGSNANASIIYEDTVNDIAILKSSKSLPYLQLGSSDELAVGEDVLAVGTPLSLSLTHSFTKGIISALNRTLKVNSGSGNGYMQNMIQHDASLNPGNSGGPLLNMRGEVIGINTLKISGGEGIGFAIPSKGFSSLLESYVENINYEVPYLGLHGYDSAIANYYDKFVPGSGFYVIDISSSSPLSECGVTRGSVIIEINNKKIDNTLDLKNELYSLNKGDCVDITYVSGGETYRTKTILNKTIEPVVN